MTRQVVGVDACKSGWVAVWFDQVSHFSRYADIADLLSHHAGDVLIDIPIGLMPAGRKLEATVRPLLGKRSSSLFSIPCREAVHADSYQAACEINQRQTGKKFAIQTWHICPKIREVDHWLQRQASDRERVIECHPELAFASLNNAACDFSKRSAEGEQERVEILARYMPGVVDLISRCRNTYPKNQVATDDLLDAAALAVTGSQGFSLMSEDEVDATGLVVRMAVPSR